jgi:hypothetical protein
MPRMSGIPVNIAKLNAFKPDFESFMPKEEEPVMV